MPEHPPTPKFDGYDSFWAFYLSQHQNPICRGLHYFGTTLGISLFAIALISQQWWVLPCAFISGYLFAWIGHYFFEHNRPATFQYPWQSFLADFKLLFKKLSGQIDSELQQLPSHKR